MDFPPRPGSSPPRRIRPEPGADPAAETGGVEPEAETEPERAAEPEAAAPVVEEVEGPAGRGSRRRRSRGDGEPPRRRRRGETFARVMWALPAIVLALVVIAAGGEIFAATMIGLAAIGLFEFFAMTARARPFQLVAFAAVAGMIVAAHFGESFHMVLAGAAFFPVMLAFAARRESLRNVTLSMAVTVFAIVWIGLPFAHAVLLRDLPDHGGALLIDVLVATFLADTCAYIGGRMVGQRPLAPSISPNKTIEGMLIGVIGGTLGFWIAGLYQDWLSGTDALLMGFFIALLAPAGDLFESMIKRDLAVKDSGRLFGPHGGLLDRLDAVLFTIVAGYYLSLAIVL